MQGKISNAIKLSGAKPYRRRISTPLSPRLKTVIILFIILLIFFNQVCFKVFFFLSFLLFGGGHFFDFSVI